MDRDPLFQWLVSQSDEACLVVLRFARYGAALHPAACPHCQCRRFRRLPGRPRIDQCCGCKAQLSVTAGTGIHGIKAPLGRLLATVYALSRPQSVSTNALARSFAISWERAAHLAHRVRAALADDAPLFDALTAKVSTLWIPAREDPESRRARSKPSVVAVAVAEGDTFAINVVERDPTMAAKHLVERYLPGCVSAPWATSPSWALLEARQVLSTTHHGVSRRWMRLYLRALGWWCGRAPLDAIRQVLRGRPRPWSRLRPPRPTARPIFMASSLETDATRPAAHP